jgi:hypothetical protein
MDDNDQDKSIIEKTIEAVKDIATIASDAAKKAMEPEPLKPGERVMMMPLMDSGLATEPMMPAFIVLPRRKSRAKTASKETAKKAGKRPVAKKSSKKKKAAKAWKPAAKAVAKKKTAKRAAKKKTKSRR